MGPHIGLDVIIQPIPEGVALGTSRNIYNLFTTVDITQCTYRAKK